MSDNKFVYILLEKVQVLCNSIKNYYNIEFKEAMKLLYNSKLYEILEDEETKMWYYSNYDLLNMYLSERETGKCDIYGGWGDG